MRNHMEILKKIELVPRGFRIPPALNPHPRAHSADLVLGLFFLVGSRLPISHATHMA